MPAEQGVYEGPGGGPGSWREEFRLDEQPGGRTILARRRQGRAAWSCEAAIDGDWRVVSLKIDKESPEGPIAARYRWDGDDWVGEVVSGALRREIALPMTRGLEVALPLASFDGAFLSRLGLAADTQRRVEVVAVDLERLDARQTHCIVERLPDEASAARYRWTDDAGRQEFVQCRQGLAVGRSTGAGEILYRLEAPRPQSV